jgi:hypothetical protein
MESALVSDDANPEAPVPSDGLDDAQIDRGSVPLRAEARARVRLEVVPRLLDGLTWLGEEISPDERGMRRVSSDLVLGVGAERPVTFHKSMIVSIGPPRRQSSGWTAAIEWQSASLMPLFPVFVGHVRIEPERVALVGDYAPPFGIIGAVLDRALLGIAARATANVIVGKFVDALTVDPTDEGGHRRSPS